jgi:hypothetical protein
MPIDAAAARGDLPTEPNAEPSDANRSIADFNIPVGAHRQKLQIGNTPILT